MKKLKIRYKILVTSLFVGFLTLILSLLFSVKTSNSKINYFMDKLLFYSANTTNQFLEKELSDIYTKAKMISQSTLLKDLIRKQEREPIVSLLALYRKDYGFEYDSASIFLKIKGTKTIKVPALAQDIAVFSKSDTYEKRFVYKNEKLFFAVNVPIFIEGKSRSDATFIIIQPITDDLIDRIGMLSGVDLSILSPEGASVATTIRGEDGMKKRFSIKLRSVEDSFDFHVPGLKYIQTGLLDEFPGTELYILISQSSRKRAENIKENSIYFLLIAILCIIASLFFSFITARKISMPLEELVHATDEISMGNLDYKVDINSGDETETLSKNFNLMASSLKNKMIELDSKIHELNSINKANQAIINIPDMNKLLYEVLKIVIDSIECEHGSLMFLEDGALKTRVVFGIEENEGVPRFDIRSGAGLAGKALKLEIPVYENNILESKDFLKYDDEIKNLNCKNLLIMPLIVDGLSLGVINLVNKDGGFTDEDVKLATTLTSEVAIALKNRKLYELAITDGLTQVYIHRYFQARLEEEIFRSKRYDLPLSLIMFDIDHFKRFNDEHGHQSGYIVLKYVASVASDVIRQEIDFISRYGGEEFTVVCPGTPYDGAIRLAERIREAICNTPIEIKGLRLTVSASFGVSSLDKNTDNKKDLIEKADNALYKAKDGGRNKVC